MSLNDRLRIVVNEFFHGNKAAFARAAKNIGPKSL